MNRILFRKILFIFIFYQFIGGLYGQMALKINSANKPTYSFYMEDANGVQPIDSTVIAGVKSLSYNYLWIFGDGTFEEHPSSRITHTFAEEGDYVTTVYAVERYDNGPPPPPLLVSSPTHFEPSSAMPAQLPKSMVARNNFIDINWFEDEWCYKDKLSVGVISIRQVKSMNAAPINGVVKLYFNGEIRKNGQVVDNMSPLLTYTKTLSYGAVNDEKHHKGTRIINGHTYRDSLEWHVQMKQDEQYFFAEFATNDILKEYVSEPNKAYTSPILLVFESDSPAAQSHKTSRATNLGFGGKVVDAQYIAMKLEGDHDPNTMTIQALDQRAKDGAYWMEGMISFTNDASGKSLVRKVKVNLDLPDTYETIEWSPSDCSENLDGIEYDGQGHWTVTKALITAADDSLRKAYHEGWLKFRLKSKPGVSFDDLKPLEASVQFGDFEPKMTEKIKPIQPQNKESKKELITFLDAKSSDSQSNNAFCESGNNKFCYGLLFALGFFVFLGVVRKILK